MFGNTSETVKRIGDFLKQGVNNDEKLRIWSGSSIADEQDLLSRFWGIDTVVDVDGIV